MIGGFLAVEIRAKRLEQTRFFERSRQLVPIPPAAMGTDIFTLFGSHDKAEAGGNISPCDYSRTSAITRLTQCTALRIESRRRGFSSAQFKERAAMSAAAAFAAANC